MQRLPPPRQIDKLEVADSSLGSFRAAADLQQAGPNVGPALAVRSAPAYGRRQGWAPRSLADFGDGGAFPEIHVAQYPLDLGKAVGQAVEKVVGLQVDANGHVAWDAVLKQGRAKDKLQVWTRPEDLREKWSKPEDLEKPGP